MLAPTYVCNQHFLIYFCGRAPTYFFALFIRDVEDAVPYDILFIVGSGFISAHFLFYFIYGLKGVCSLSQTIEEIKRGIVYSEVYTQEQLLSYESKLLARNIFAFVSTIVLFTNYVYQTIILFIRKLNNTSATTKSTFHNNWKSE